LGFGLGCSKNSDQQPQPEEIDKSANVLGTGDSARDILSNEKFSKMQIEVVYVQNFRPTQEAMNNFVAYLRDRTFKQDIEVIYREVPSSGEADLSLPEIADIEDENRAIFNNGETLAIYIYFADAPSVDDDENEGLVTLGAVYRNTSMIIYESTVRKLAGQSNQITEADVETASLNHEFGHLFGLVDLGTSQVNDHEDPNAQNHCNISGCLMRAELQFGGGVMSMLESRASKGILETPGLDAECILDLQGNGGR
jgi:hypothetical protein